MLTREDDIDAHALRRQGWTISAIARHLGRDRKTVRAYLAGGEAGVRARSWADRFEPFAAYCAQRLRDDPHLWASTLFNELLKLGFARSYPTMTRQLRDRGLRPACEPCRPTKDRAIAVIEHPPGAETQWAARPAAPAWPDAVELWSEANGPSRKRLSPRRDARPNGERRAHRRQQPPGRRPRR
jgi:transposase